VTISDKWVKLVASGSEGNDEGDGDQQGDHNGENGNNNGSAAAIIDAVGRDNGIVIRGSAAAGTVVRGFTVVNANLEGIWAIQTSRVTIENNKLFRNDAYGPNNPNCSANPDDCGEALHFETVTFSTARGNLIQFNVGGILLTDEEGPAAHNRILNNKVIDNTKDCGITLASHYFQLGAPVSPAVGGVYDNLVKGNDSERNGAAGIGAFAGPPGAAAWGNRIVGNVAKDNGLPGVAIHSHSPFQLVKDNLISENTLVNNGPDDDAQTVFPTGIAIWADPHGAPPVQHTVISENRIRNDYYGIYIANVVNTVIHDNSFSNVVVPVFHPY
jgi:parallel beta-helix repeat protein